VLDYLTKIGLENNLRHAIQLLTPAQIRAKDQDGDSATKDGVEYVKGLFPSLKESVRYVKQHEVIP